MAAHVGFVFQNPDHQIFCSTTKEEIAFGPTALGLDGATVFERVDEMLTLFDLHRYRRRLAGHARLRRTPCGGAVIRACNAHADPRARRAYGRSRPPSRSTLPRHHRETQPARRHHRSTISHDMRAVYRYCTHVLELEDGKVVQYGPIDRSEAAQKQSRTIRKPA